MGSYAMDGEGPDPMNGGTWTAADLQRLDDPVATIRMRPRMYLDQSGDRGRGLAVRIAGDVLAMAPDALVRRAGDWWVVSSSVDWIRPGDGEPLSAYFRRMSAFPEAGDNAFHGEVLLVAFAQDVVTTDGACWVVIAGEAPPAALQPQILSSAPHAGRTVAYRMVPGAEA